MNVKDNENLSREEENCLKSALAFVVLRKRIASSLEDDNTSKEQQLKRYKNEDEGNEKQMRPLVHTLLTPLYSFRHHSRSNDGNLPNIDSETHITNSGLINVNEGDLHILSMLRLAVSIALALYNVEEKQLPSKCKGSHEDHDQSDKYEDENTDDDELEEPKFFPPIYDYNSAAASPSTSLKVLDGVLSHVSRLLHSKLYRPEISSQESIESVVNLIQDGLIKVLFPTATYSSSCNTKKYSCLKEGESTASNISTILAVCTVLHRMIYIDESLGLPAIRCVSRFMKILYQDECKRPIICRDTSESTKKQNSNDDEYHDVSATMPQLTDVIAVNFLYLLEGISAIKVKSKRKRYDNGNNERFFGGSDHHISKIIIEIQSELNELTIPIHPKEITHFYFKESKRQSALQEKNKLNLRNERAKFSMNRRRMQGKGIFNGENKDEKGELGGKVENDELSDQTEGRDRMECLYLFPAAKIMFRSFLFKILDKLSAHAT